MTQVTINLPDTEEEAIEMSNGFINFWSSLGCPRNAVALHLLYLHTLCSNEVKIETFEDNIGVNFRLVELIKHGQEFPKNWKDVIELEKLAYRKGFEDGKKSRHRASDQKSNGATFHQSRES